MASGASDALLIEALHDYASDNGGWSALSNAYDTARSEMLSGQTITAVSIDGLSHSMANDITPSRLFAILFRVKERLANPTTDDGDHKFGHVNYATSRVRT